MPWEKFNKPVAKRNDRLYAKDCIYHYGGERSLCPLTMAYCQAKGRPCQWGRRRDA